MNLNPRRALTVTADYDSERGYSEAHARCANECGFVIPPRPLDRLDRDGFDVVDCVSPETASEVARQDWPTALDRVLSGPLATRIRIAFTSEFAPIHVKFIYTKAGEENPSFFWHCDAGPVAHLKVLVYLNETDAATGIISRAETDLFEKAGYPFGPLSERVGDDGLNEIAVQGGFTYRPVWTSPRPGRGVLFEPRNVLHRGRPPFSGAREMLQVVFVPWNTPWQQFVDEHRDWIEDNVGAGFPRLVPQ